MDKALRLFWASGYETLSVAVICRELGINPTSFYAAFESKARLFIEAVQCYEKTYWQEPLSAFEASPGPVAMVVEKFFLQVADMLSDSSTPDGCIDRACSRQYFAERNGDS